MSVLNKLVSYYPSVTETGKGVEADLLHILQSKKAEQATIRLRNESDPVLQKALKAGIKGNNWKPNSFEYAHVMRAINEANHQEIKRQLEYGLPCFTTAGVFKDRSNAGLITPSGLAAIDLDSAEDYDLPHLLIELRKIRFIAYAGYSCRGQRLFCIIPFATNEYAKHYEMLVNSFIRMEFPMGDDCHKKISQPRFVACNDDTTQFFNHTADAYNLLPPEKTHHFIQRQPNRVFNNEPTDKFQFASNILKNQSYSFVDGNKHNYIFNLCRLLNKMGATKAEAEEYISTFFPLDQIHSNCITGPYSHYANEFNTWNFQTQNSFENSFKVEQPPPVLQKEIEQPETISILPAPTISYENFQKTEVQPQPVNWEEEITTLETFFTSAIIPQSIQLNAYSDIKDVPKFIDSHLATVKSNSGKRIFEPYLLRLQELKSILSQ